MKLTDQIDALRAYLLVKVELQDWHGVRDACVDIELLQMRSQVEAEFARDPSRITHRESAS